MNKLARHLAILAFGLILGVQIQLVAGKNISTGERKAELPLNELRTFTEVFAKIKNDYVEEVGDKALLENAIRGMLSGLDPHSAYLDAEDYEGLQEGTSGEFGGLGIEVGMEDGFVKVIAPIDDTPAQKAGMKAGDLIIRIDGTAVKGMTINDAVKKMRGEPGTSITLTVVREGREQPLKFTLVRAIIKVQSVKSQTLEPQYGYVRISQFQSGTGEDLSEAITRLKKENKDNIKGLILDLRNNPGGVLNSAVSVADAFLESGLIVYTKGRIKDSELSFNAKPNDLLKGAPIVVLVNAGSASASEIVAGALQDRKRAVIMGGKTFGKGSVQTILPMNNQAALKLTTALYFTPSGRSIQAEGITPDIALEKVKIAASEDAADMEVIKEADLSRHLGNGNGKSGAKPAKEPAGSNSGNKGEAPGSLAVNDYEIYEALNLLKGMAVLQERGSKFN
jgi:carboxyl-terminal processing protease